MTPKTATSCISSIKLKDMHNNRGRFVNNIRLGLHTSAKFMSQDLQDTVIHTQTRLRPFRMTMYSPF